MTNRCKINPTKRDATITWNGCQNPCKMSKVSPTGAKGEAKGSKMMGCWTGRCGGMKKMRNPAKYERRAGTQEGEKGGGNLPPIQVLKRRGSADFRTSFVHVVFDFVWKIIDFGIHFTIILEPFGINCRYFFGIDFLLLFGAQFFFYGKWSPKWPTWATFSTKKVPSGGYGLPCEANLGAI